MHATRSTQLLLVSLVLVELIQRHIQQRDERFREIPNNNTQRESMYTDQQRGYLCEDVARRVGEYVTGITLLYRG